MKVEAKDSEAVLLGFMKRSQEGDNDAFDQLVLAMHRDVAGFVAARLPVPEAIDEAVQDAFVSVYRHRQAFEPERGDLRAWVKGHARHCILRHLHERARSRGRGLEGLEALFSQSARDGLEVDDDEPAWQRLDGCLQGLGPMARDLLDARFRQGVPLGELAQQLGRSYASLANAITRARAALRSCLDQGGIKVAR